MPWYSYYWLFIDFDKRANIQCFNFLSAPQSVRKRTYGLSSILDSVSPTIDVYTDFLEFFKWEWGSIGDVRF